jgi:hypothetical protein
MDSSTQLFLSVFIGSFGLAYFVYGKKQRRLVPSLSGIAMMVYPYFVKNLYLVLAVAVVCLILPFVISE